MQQGFANDMERFSGLRISCKESGIIYQAQFSRRVYTSLLPFHTQDDYRCILDSYTASQRPMGRHTRIERMEGNVQMNDGTKEETYNRIEPPGPKLTGKAPKYRDLRGERERWLEFPKGDFARIFGLKTLRM